MTRERLDQLVEEFIATMKWTDADKDTRDLVIGNVRGVAAYIAIKEKLPCESAPI